MYLQGYLGSNPLVKICQIRGNLPLRCKMAIPSQVPPGGKGVETKRQTSATADEEIVQITKSKGVAKAIVICITFW